MGLDLAIIFKLETIFLKFSIFFIVSFFNLCIGIFNFLDICSASAFVFGHLQSFEGNSHVEHTKPPMIS